jgi:hypothetical protein
MSTLAQYLACIRQKVDDTGTLRYTDAMLTENLEMAVKQYSKRKPLLRTYSLDSTNSKRITLPADFIAMAIVDVEWVSILADFNDRIAFYAYKPDEQWIIETPGKIIPLGESFNIYYHALHTIDGLNAAAGTTIPDADEEIVQTGAAGFAALARSYSKVESNNLNQNEAKELAAQGRDRVEQFYTGIGAVESLFAFASWHDQGIDKNF